VNQKSETPIKTEEGLRWLRGKIKKHKLSDWRYSNRIVDVHLNIQGFEKIIRRPLNEILRNREIRLRIVRPLSFAVFSNPEDDLSIFEPNKDIITFYFRKIVMKRIEIEPGVYDEIPDYFIFDSEL